MTLFEATTIKSLISCFAKRKSLLILPVIASLLNLFDVELTNYGLRQGLLESNPLFQGFNTALIVDPAIAILKIVLIPVSFLVCNFVWFMINGLNHRKLTSFIVKVELVFALMYFVVCLNNVYQLTLGGF